MIFIIPVGIVIISGVVCCYLDNRDNSPSSVFFWTVGVLTGALAMSVSFLFMMFAGK